MANLTEQRRRFSLAALAMAAVCLLAGLYLLAPITVSSAQRQQQLLEKQRQLRATEEQTRPIQRLPELVAKAQSDIAKFYSDRLPAFPSAVYNNIYDLAQRNRVNLSEVKYEAYDTGVATLQLLQVEAKVSGGYANLVRFINSVERSQLFFVVDDLQLSDVRGKESIQLTLRMETYLRPRTANERPVAGARGASQGRGGSR